MKLTIDYNKDQLADALETKMNVLKRKQKAETNIGIVELLEKDISELRHAINSIQQQTK